MSQKKNTRRYLRQLNSDEAPKQVGVIIVSNFDGKAFLAYDNGCKKVWSNDDPYENPDAYRWDCPEGVDPPDDGGGDKAIDDDYNPDDDDDGETLIYKCMNRKLCNESSPADSSSNSSGGWKFLGVCDFEGGVCPFPKYDASKNYKKGEEVAVEVDRLLHECTDSSKCNGNVPGIGVGDVDDGWELFGGCKTGGNCNAEEFDTSKAASAGYKGGDDVFTRISFDYGTIGTAEGSTGGGGSLSETIENGSSSGGGAAGGGGGEEDSDSFKLIYQCNNKEQCNSTRPGDPSAEGWDLVGTCSNADETTCAKTFADNGEYNLGDQVSVAVDRLLHECIDKSSCNDNVPGVTSGDGGWKLIGGCKEGRICNAEEFDASKATIDGYEGGDKVFTTIGTDYGTIGSGITGGGASENGEDSIFCPGFKGEDGGEGTTKALVTYAYEVETVQVTDANTFLPRLEGQILSNLAASMLSCLKDERLRRRLEDYGVSGIESFPVDVPVTGGLCTFESAAADGCFAIDGGLTLSLNPGVDSKAAADSTRALLEEAMSGNALLSPDIPEVVKVKYLGESYDDYVADQSSSGQQGGASGAGSGSTKLPDNDATGTITPGGKRGPPIALIAVLATLGVLAIILLVLLYVKRRRNKETKDELDTHGDDSDLEDDLDDVIDRIGGIGNQPQTTFANDPPGSFHMGSHHYTEDGVQYKSLSCAQCQAAKAAGAMAVFGLMTSNNQEELEDVDLNDTNDLSFDLDLAKNFVDFSRNDLGRTHSSINVRHCKSATCGICKKTGGVVFVKTEL